MRNWILPEYVEDILPAESLHIEKIRRQMLDLMHVHGYQLVIPPLLEYTESLLSGSGSDMDLHMFKVVDQLSGRMLGLRADITPQAARIDAHLLNAQGVTRLCYASSVLHTIPCEIARTREPFQIGAELYGHSGLESDIEIQHLMLQCLVKSGVGKIQLDLGHVAIFRCLIKDLAIKPALETDFYTLLRAKDLAALKELLQSTSTLLSKNAQEMLLHLPELYGDRKILIEARKLLPEHPEIIAALDQLEVLAEKLACYVDRITFDLSDLRGYHYHTGIVFAAYTKGNPGPIALGGRYDEIGKSFGRSRPATGFSMDLRELSRLAHTETSPKGILAPYKPDDKLLQEKVIQLRASGWVVITLLPGCNEENDATCCDKKLVLKNDTWDVVEI
ncbi:MAG TPA: ATP phosphoribosyltransferase regulatory subunit [Nitrosomonas sp.]|nr:ATP phosphoribosyltransferase regulatory subunit [Nitrosomonas sp.]